jgi:8-oxo-dGTP pyrophosphatase MutT (NUDIX family)
MTAASARPASTVIVVRDESNDLEVFLVRRHDRLAFMGGAHVFPGGRVDDADVLPDPGSVCDGVSRAITRMPAVAPAQAIAFHVAAIRELFEEAGLLLARREDGAIVAIDAASATRFDRLREALLANALTMRDVIARERLRLALDALTLVAHWVTPEADPARFDTRFFLAVAPASQVAAHDAHETTHGLWMRPADALDSCRRGEIALPPATWTMLRRLARFTAPADAWNWAQSCRVPRVEPCLTVGDNGSRMVTLPGDPLCTAVEGFDAEETRFLLEEGRWTVVAPGAS